MALFSLREKLPERLKLQIEIGGAILFFFIWWSIVHFGLIQASILPNPIDVVTSVPEMYRSGHLMKNLAYSIGLNVAGYIEAIALSIPLGFIIGLFAPFRALSERLLSAMRFLPLTAVTGLFIIWFGISHNMKIQFLTLGILVYLLPVVVQRIDEVQQVYLDTAKTLGATRWQRIRTVFLPDVISRVSDDIRVLVAISWTYIIIAESVDLNEGGIGAMVIQSSRQSIAKTFALVILILVVGFLQDKIWIALDRRIFRFKNA